MNIGYHLMAWRRGQGLTQAELATRAHLTRPYVSRLEKGNVDPALSSLRRLSVALGLRISQLLEALPSQRPLDREELDQLARGALQPGAKNVRSRPEVRVLARMIQERRKALGFYIPKKKRTSAKPLSHPAAVNAARWLRASLGEAQWNALLRRINKLASSHPGPP